MDPTVTVLTCTYNRANTLPIVFQSLMAQGYRDFEWRIEDDGSTDNTKELVEQFRLEAFFPIEYSWSENKGKHVAHNRGAREAKGKYFICIDSDDALTPNALQKFMDEWAGLAEEKALSFSSVCGLCTDQAGTVCGMKFPTSPLDSDPWELRARYGVTGEKCACHRTEVIREFPFPEDISTTFCPEDLVWFEIGRKYKTRFVNEVFRIYIQNATSITRQTPATFRQNNRLLPIYMLNRMQSYFLKQPKFFAKNAANYVRFSKHCGLGASEMLAPINTVQGKLLCLFCSPIGIAFYLRDKRRN